MNYKKEIVYITLAKRMPDKPHITPEMTNEIEILQRLIKGLGWKKAHGDFYYKTFLIGVPDK